MKIKITKCTNRKYWYKKYIGNIYTVKRKTRYDFIVKTGLPDESETCEYCVDISDAEVLNEAKRSEAERPIES